MKDSSQKTRPERQRSLLRWNTLSLRTKGLLVISMPLAGMFLAGGFFLKVQSSAANAEQWVQHTLEVKAGIERVQRLLTDAVASRRSYMLTGEESLLAARDQAKEALPRAMNRLGSLVSDNPLQRERAQSQLRSLLDSYFAIATIEPARSVVSPKAKAQLHEADVVLGEFQALTSDMMDEEDRLLAVRQVRAEAARKLLLIGMIGTLGLGLFVAGTAGWLFSGGIARRIEQLLENTKLLERQEPLKKFNWGRDEISHLGRALDGASALLTLRQKELLRTNSELKRRAAESERAEAETAAILHHSLDVICTVDREGRFVRVSDASQKLWGYAPEKLIGKCYIDLVHPDDREITNVAATEIMSGVANENFQNRYIRKDGSVAQMMWSATWSEPDSIMYCVARDVTDKRRAEENLRASEERFRSVTESLSDAVISGDQEGNIIFWNPAATSVFGYTQEEALGQPLTMIMPERYREGHRHGLERFQKTGEKRVIGNTVELEGLHKDGREFPVELSLSIWHTSEGEFYTGIVRDITVRKKVETDLLSAKEAAEIANRAKSEFLANMSHEIRTPMNGIIGMTDLTLETGLDRTQREYLEMVKHSADSLLSLINDILDFSKIESGKLSLESVTFDLRASLEKTLKTLGIRADRKGLELTCRIEPQVPEAVVGDPVRLRQILINLVDNAIKFTEKGEINLTVKRVREHDGDGRIALDFSVKDTGIGIEPEKREKIFAAFSQADSSTTRTYGGTGLGLTISSRLVEQMGGRITVDGAPGRGSTFQFVAKFERAVEKPVPTFTLTRDLENLSVLIVDDNATNRLILREMVSSWRMRPKEVASAREALTELMAAAARNKPYALVLLDALMPEIDGFTLVEKIKSTPALNGAILMMLSSAGRTEQSERWIECGLAGYLTKPITQSELLDAILRVFSSDEISPAASAKEAPAQISGLRILVADDNAVNRSVAQGILSRQGHRVMLAENGREAVDLNEREKFDLILMDVQMPVLDGFDATAEIRSREAAHEKRTPIIAMTAHAMAGDRERCLAAGMDGYVSKPLRKQELIETVLEFGFGAHRAETTNNSTENNLLAHFDGDLELLEKVGHIFAEQTPAMLSKLRGAITSHDATILKQTAHTLIGSLGAFGADRAVDCARLLEALADAQSFERAEKVFSELTNEVDTIQSRLAAVRS